MTPDAPELLLNGRERTFMVWWFDRLAGCPGAFPLGEWRSTPMPIRAATASVPGSRNIAPMRRTFATIAGWRNARC